MVSERQQTSTERVLGVRAVVRSEQGRKICNATDRKVIRVVGMPGLRLLFGGRRGGGLALC